MRSKLNRFPRFILSLLGLALLVAVSAEAQQLPRSVAIGTNPPGTLFYAAGSGIAKVASDVLPFQVLVQPYSGTSTFLPLLNSGELEFGINNAVDMGLAYGGPGVKIGGRNPLPFTPNARLAMRGGPLLIGLLVKKDSPIKTVHELKGQRVTGEYPAQLAVWYNMYGALTSAGLTWDDVKVVPVPAVNDGVEALGQGRADVSISALGVAKVKEVDAAIGLRHMSIDCSPEGEKRLRKGVPGYYPHRVKAGGSTAVVEDTCVIAYDVYLTVGKGVPNGVVSAVLKGLWENFDKLGPIHPHLRQWNRERAVDDGVTIPYHPGAVAFYKEHGQWSAKMDDAQKRLLALNP